MLQPIPWQAGWGSPPRGPDGTHMMLTQLIYGTQARHMVQLLPHLEWGSPHLRILTSPSQRPNLTFTVHRCSLSTRTGPARQQCAKGVERMNRYCQHSESRPQHFCVDPQGPPDSLAQVLGSSPVARRHRAGPQGKSQAHKAGPAAPRHLAGDRQDCAAAVETSKSTPGCLAESKTYAHMYHLKSFCSKSFSSGGPKSAIASNRST